MRHKKLIVMLCIIFSLSAAAGCGTSKDTVDSVATEKVSSSDATKDVTEEISILDISENETEQISTSDTTENTGDETGSSDPEISNAYDTMKKELESVEETAKNLNDKIQTEEMTQLELNETTEKLYQIWDDELNRVWNCLKSNLDEERMEQITAEEREWISYKESEISNAGADYEGGSMQAMIENGKGAELTKARVYELIEYLK